MGPLKPCERWEDAALWAAEAAGELRAPAGQLKQAIAVCYTDGDVGLYLAPTGETAAVFGRAATDNDLAAVKAAAAPVLGPAALRSEPLTHAEASSGAWIKVAYSQGLRDFMTPLNFFPGRYPGGIPNAPSPLAATLSGSLLGAGLGYGVGAVAERLLPESWTQHRLRRTLAMLGGMGGAVPGGAGILAAWQQGHSILDGQPLSPPPLSTPELAPADLPLGKSAYAEPLAAVAHQPLPGRSGVLVARLTKAAETAMGFGLTPVTRIPSVLDVNIDAAGRTLWEAGAGPALTGTTLAALQAAAQLPGGAGPGLVTPEQLGRLAMGAGAGYATGALVGAVLGALTGLPPDVQNSLRNSGALVGVVQTAVPALFGR